MCVRVYVCEHLVLPESLLNLKHAFRILSIFSLPFWHFLIFSPQNQYLPNVIIDGPALGLF